jgi:hypothetical protein
MVDEGYVVTGAKFTRMGFNIGLEVLMTPFNFTTGKLMPERSVLKKDPITSIKLKLEKELKLIKPDIPTRVTNTDRTTNRYVQFVSTNYYKDAGQTTVPFFDAQPVNSKVPVPLSGIGIYHKGRSGSGGFIAPRIFSYNFAAHLPPLKELPDNNTINNILQKSPQTTASLGCDKAFYGTNCTKRCGHCSKGSCDRINGTCSPCLEDYVGSKCDICL